MIAPSLGNLQSRKGNVDMQLSHVKQNAQGDFESTESKVEKVRPDTITLYEVTKSLTVT